MRYYLRNATLIIRGNFRAASTGINGGIGQASTLLNHTVPPGWDHHDPARVLRNIVAREGVPEDFFGLLTGVDMKKLCILQYDFITIFITAGLQNGGMETQDSINIIIISSEGLTDAALLGSIITATEAKVLSLTKNGYALSETSTDAIIVASEAEPIHPDAGPLTDLGKRIREAVIFGIPEALKRFEGTIIRDSPSFFILSRYGGQHWVEWIPEECPYYPCHFPDQRCDFCYCPFYPCKDESLGQWVSSSSGNGVVWNCASCTLLHKPEICQYLTQNPEATLSELKARNRLLTACRSG